MRVRGGGRKEWEIDRFMVSFIAFVKCVVFSYFSVRCVRVY